MQTHTVLTSIICVAAALAVAGSAAGCKESDAIVERTLNQNSDNVDVDNPDKFYVPDESSKINVKDLDLDIQDLLDRDRIIEDEATQEQEDEKDKKDKEKYDEKTPEDNTTSQATAGGDDARSDGTGGLGGSDSGGGNGTGTGSNGSGTGGNAQNSGEGGESEGQGGNAGSHSVDMNDDSYQERTYDATYGNTKNLPTNATTVAAVGELATMTLMMGNEDTLKGAPKDYLARTSIKDVFSSKGVAKAKAVWSSSESKTTDAQCEKLIDLNCDVCLVYPGQLTANQERLIAQNCPNMAVITLPRPTSAANIKTAMKAIAQLLSDSTDGSSTKLYNDYVDFEQQLVKEAENAHGGGVVTYNAVDYSSTDNTKIIKVNNASSNQLWTLYISGWDTDAKVKASYQGTPIFTDTGAAYTHTGWVWSPLSYYMSVGGIINNAAAYGPVSTQTLQPVLCFNENQVTYKWSNFCVSTNESKGGGSYTNQRGFYVLTNARDGVDESGTNPSAVHGLGSDDFNTVIVKSQAIKSELTKARKENDGLYTLYGQTSTITSTGNGRKFVGKTGESIVYNTVLGDAGYQILVNPCGYVGSWTDGSVEAPLESLWIASQYWGYSSSKLRDNITEFYQRFYGYSNPNVDKILNGSYVG